MSHGAVETSAAPGRPRRFLQFRLSTLLLLTTVVALLMGHLAKYVTWRRHAVARHNELAGIVSTAMTAAPPGMRLASSGNMGASGGQLDESWIASATARFSRNPGMTWTAMYDAVLSPPESELADSKLAKRIFDFYSARINWPAEPTSSVVAESRSLRIWDGMYLDLDVDVDHLAKTATVWVIFIDTQKYSGW